MHTLPTALLTVLRDLARMSPAARERLLNPDNRGQLRTLLRPSSSTMIGAYAPAYAVAQGRVG